MKQYGTIACMIGTYYYKSFMNKIKMKEFLPELYSYNWVRRTLKNSTSCFNMFMMSRALFGRLHNLLVSSYDLKSLNKMSSLEALAMFLWMIGAPQSIRQAENRFERSTEMISRKFQEVLHSVFMLSADIIKPRDPEFRTVHLRLQGP
uniref:DUF8040 domain-containing protein n=1 Tax=Arundo donax TaxID=35708 RepID=A0A0A8XZU9_ARUDO